MQQPKQRLMPRGSRPEDEVDMDRGGCHAECVGRASMFALPSRCICKKWRKWRKRAWWLTGQRPIAYAAAGDFAPASTRCVSGAQHDERLRMRHTSTRSHRDGSSHSYHDHDSNEDPVYIALSCWLYSFDRQGFKVFSLLAGARSAGRSFLASQLGHCDEGRIAGQRTATSPLLQQQFDNASSSSICDHHRPCMNRRTSVRTT